MPTKSLPNCLSKLVYLLLVYFGTCYKKNAKKLQDVFKRRQQEFLSNLDNLFDIAHADALQLMKIEEGRMFLQRQSEPDRPGHLGGVDKKLTTSSCQRIKSANQICFRFKILDNIRTIARRFLFEF
ncbi:hypothetical protein AVEN_101508-1 [Araneus ventricosus]|uniref:Uncharacterized protein n=1 Tax=Araneus ventricosus TaxID=182803 RepID=A0A4Y2RMQ8_ARAVE|nr:hypothetical protein AVEN_101508-1 [Araneus ventricosus]